MLSGRLSILLMLSCYSCLAIRGAHSLVARKSPSLAPARQRIPSPALFTTHLKSTTIDDTELPLLSLPPQICKTVVDLQLPEGRCFVVAVEDLDESNPESLFPHQISKPDHWIRSVLHAEEVAYGLEKGKSSSSTSIVPNHSFWVGRLAMRAALGFPEYPVLKDIHGRPKLVSGMCGSISHKPGIGVALVAPLSSRTAVTRSGVGIDLEVTRREGKMNIARKILTEAEKESLGRIPGITEEEEILLRFRWVRWSDGSHRLRCGSAP
jgi:4'-phosphopantetheinyl transferase N-terminal domain